MPWLQIHVRTQRQHAGHAEAALEALGALSVTLEDGSDQPILEPAPGEAPLWNSTVVTGLFDGDTDASLLEKAVANAIGDESSQVTVERLDDQPWERAWLDHFHPMRFGKRLWICPHGQPLPEQGDQASAPVVLKLDPGLAFGTGTHPTTALCLEWLESADLEGKTVIDYGCGSGILGIAALLLGARKVIAVDHDPQALTATLANARENGVADRVETFLPGEAPADAADIVVANILASVLIDLSSVIGGHVSAGGRLALSGILDNQSDSVAAAYADVFSLEPAVLKDGWALLSGRKR